MRISSSEALYITVAYADIFNYPLTREECLLWFASSGRNTQQYFSHQDVKIAHKGHTYWYHLQQRSQIIGFRRMHSHWSKKKWKRAKKVSSFFKMIPSIQLVGVTGGLTMNNVDKDDDIDLFFIVSSNTIWITRFLVTIITDFIGVRRKPLQTEFRDKICLNMFMTENALALPFKERDFFSAHEVLQMKPLWERDDTYQKFLMANRWAEKFLPNAWRIKSEIPASPAGRRNPKSEIISKSKPLNSKRFEFWILNFEFLSDFVLRISNLFMTWFLRGLEFPSRKIQLWYMSRHRTSEVVTDTMIRFHPRDARVWIKEELGRRLQKQKLPLDKIFYGR